MSATICLRTFRSLNSITGIKVVYMTRPSINSNKQRNVSPSKRWISERDYKKNPENWLCQYHSYCDDHNFGRSKSVENR